VFPRRRPRCYSRSDFVERSCRGEAYRLQEFPSPVLDGPKDRSLSGSAGRGCPKCKDLDKKAKSEDISQDNVTLKPPNTHLVSIISPISPTLQRFHGILDIRRLVRSVLGRDMVVLGDDEQLTGCAAGSTGLNADGRPVTT
jgi:hypothetical protein